VRTALHICNTVILYDEQWLHICTTVILCDEQWLLDKRKHISLLSSVFGSSYSSEQMFGLIKNVKSRTKTHLSEEHLVGCMRIATTEINPDTEKLTKQKGMSSND
jgi:hypothetical protein